jgi:enoyl-CoA hydratase/carnithine racemase
VRHLDAKLDGAVGTLVLDHPEKACSLRAAKEMAFTAKPISAERAARLGIINHMVSMEQLEIYT